MGQKMTTSTSTRSSGMGNPSTKKYRFHLRSSSSSKGTMCVLPAPAGTLAEEERSSEEEEEEHEDDQSAAESLQEHRSHERAKWLRRSPQERSNSTQCTGKSPQAADSAAKSLQEHLSIAKSHQDERCAAESPQEQGSTGECAAISLQERIFTAECAAKSLQEHLSTGKSQEERDFTLDLPEECLGLIFDKLDNHNRNLAALVCKRWLHAEGSSRRILTLSGKSTNPCLRSALIRFSSLSKLGLRCERGVQSVSDEALDLIALHCLNLSKLKLKYCTAITDTGIENFAVTIRSRNFRSFSCCSCGFGARGLNALIRNCNSLEDLSVKKLQKIKEEPNELVLGQSNLKRLSVKNMENGHVFAPLIAGSKQLYTLIVFKVVGQWDKLLELVVDGILGLTELKMERIDVGDRGLQAIAKCRNLQVLFLSRTPHCSNDGITAIANGCRSLRKLHIDGCFSGRIGDKGLISIAAKCHELKELVLIGLSVTSESLRMLFTNCTGLERLALWNSESFGDTELSCIAEKCGSLRKVCIKSCPISDKGLEALVCGCPKLSKVKIKRCSGVSASGTHNLMQAHAGLVITLESDPAAVLLGMNPVAPVIQYQPAVNANPPPPARSPFSRARSAIVAALGRVLA